MHTDAQATESAQAVNAQAFTVGKEVIFGAGQYSPGTNEWRRLMAHAVQQTQSRITSNQT